MRTLPAASSHSRGTRREDVGSRSRTAGENATGKALIKQGFKLQHEPALQQTHAYPEFADGAGVPDTENLPNNRQGSKYWKYLNIFAVNTAKYCITDPLLDITRYPKLNSKASELSCVVFVWDFTGCLPWPCRKMSGAAQAPVPLRSRARAPSAPSGMI